jgi:uncharacterized protein with HEPN domain
MLSGALLGLMEQTALDVMVLTDEISDAEFFASHLTRAQTLQLLGSLVKSAASLPEDTRVHMPEIDWDAWAALGSILPKASQHPLQIWVAIKELTPMTVQLLNGYKRTQPKLFSFVP